MNGAKIGMLLIVAPTKRILKVLQNLPVKCVEEEVGAIMNGLVAYHPATLTAPITMITNMGSA